MRQGHFEVIRYTCLKVACDLKNFGHRLVHHACMVAVEEGRVIVVHVRFSISLSLISNTSAIWHIHEGNTPFKRSVSLSVWVRQVAFGNISFLSRMHLLYFCSFSKNIWNTVDAILKTSLTVKDMFLYDNLSVTFATSVILYLLYKSWLFIKDTGKLQTGRELLGFIKSEIKYKLTVYKSMSIRIDVCALQQLLEELK